ncbi:endosomal cargo receptor [Lichtheimia corymbifera JMRC:FSU:9682]|uniref:Endosomal cargo receptor n=1 Tax=Lichtheimia corymbifera JMRC:FSU:9682 TaxID=1263082 RepID=A0A068RZN5_9FUNG|nr:endosomal cargo receptor [Lichtheimia corymbifera JMRC:FSU:9682]
MVSLTTRRLTCWLIAILAIFTKVSDALYFYLEGAEKKCFLEELPKETMVTGIYKAEQFSATQNQWIVNPEARIQITVEELPQEHVVVNRQDSPSGRFTFTSAESGDHSICLSVASTSWFDSTKTRMTFDMDFDDPAGEQHDHTETLSDMAKRIHDLNERVQDIRREQAAQREREAEFRDQSELTNSRVVWWTITQLAVLGGICVWQMRHYKSFFVAKKLV